MNSDYMDIVMEDTLTSPVNEISELGLYLISYAIVIVPLIGAIVAIDSRRKKEIKEAIKTYEKVHKDDPDFIKGSEFKISRYSLKNTIYDTTELDKENDKITRRDNAFVRLMNKLPAARKKDFFKRAKYNNNAIVFSKDDGGIYFYMIYSVKESGNGTVTSINYISTSDTGDKYQDYYSAYACMHIGYTSKHVFDWAKRYNDENFSL